MACRALDLSRTRLAALRRRATLAGRRESAVLSLEDFAHCRGILDLRDFHVCGTESRIAPAQYLSDRRFEACPNFRRLVV
jgi:hypothetical protein